MPFEDSTEIYWNMISSLQYLSNFYETILHKIRKQYVYVENLVENSAMNNCLIWSGGVKNNPINYCFMESDSVSFALVEQLCKFHEINMRSLLTDESSIYSIFGLFRVIKQNPGDGILDYEETFISMLDRLIFQVLTLFKVNSNFDACLEFASYVRNIYRTEMMQQKLKALDAKIELYVADIYLRRMLTLRRTELNKVKNELLIEQLTLIDELTSNFEF